MISEFDDNTYKIHMLVVLSGYTPEPPTPEESDAYEYAFILKDMDQDPVNGGATNYY